MKRKLSIITAVMATFTFSAAQAQTYTYMTKDNPGMQVGTTAPNGRVIAATANTGQMTITMADGSKITETYTCIGTTQPPNAKIFDAHTICDASGPNGSYTATFGCTNMEGGAQGCVGGLYGKTGKYVGRGGGTTWMGKDGVGRGTGQWSD
jgi:hypothetical protein